MPIQSSRPVGSLERIIELGRNPAEWGTCSPPQKAESIGCKQWAKCPWRFGKPKNFGVLIAKPTSSGDVASIVPMACYDHLATRDQIKANGGVAKVVAQEGEKIRVRGTKRITPMGQGHRELTRDDEEAYMTVRPFPDPAERTDMASAVYLRELAEDMNGRGLRGLREQQDAEDESAREAAFLGSTIAEKLTADGEQSGETTGNHEAGRGKSKRVQP